MNKVPNHISIILDGNGRWAEKQNKPRTFGHKKGMSIIEEISLHAQELGVKYLSLFCFSTENWNRPKKEVEYLIKIPKNFFSKQKIKFFNSNNIKINFIGSRDRLPEDSLTHIDKAIEETKDNKGLVLTIAFNYGSKEEISTAFKNLANKILNKKIDIDDINYDLIYNNLYTFDLPPVDLLIRTGGEKRISNFLLLQIAYAELYFTPILWPDFNKEQLIIALEDYSSRDRRFGEIKNERK